MKGLRKVAQWYVIAMVLAWLLPLTCFTTVAPDEIGVRQSNFTGVAEEDLDAGWAYSIPGAHKIIRLPRRYEYLDYVKESGQEGQQLQIRTKDNNIVYIDVSVPYRIKAGEGWEVVKAGNHQKDSDDRYRFQRLATETTVSVLRERLADLSSADFYSTDRRLEVALTTLELLNEKLGALHLEAERVLIRAVQFRGEYEQQLQQIQLNEQKKLLDEATETVAIEQQTLDNYMQGTNAIAASSEQRWIEARSAIERGYQVGLVEVGEETGPGASRRALAALEEGAREELLKQAAETLGITEDDAISKIDDSYLLGIRNIQAETLEYDKRVRTEADGVSARLSAEGDAEIAAVRGAYEGRVNELLNTNAGRAYVAWKTAEKITFDSNLVFNSSDGVPSILRLREFTELFMGKR